MLKRTLMLGLISLVQTSLFRCRWASLSRLKKAEKMWLHQTAITDLANVADSTLEQFQGNFPCNSFEDDFRNFCSLVQASDSEPQWNLDSLLQISQGCLVIHPETEIPDYLLRGPWTEDMVMHLFWFARAGARINLLYSTSGEVSLHILLGMINNMWCLFLLHTG